MAVSEKVIVELEARLGRYEANVAGAERKFSAAMSGIQKSATATEGLVGRAMGGIAGALAGVSAVALARQFLDIADASKNLEAQLRLATNGFGSFTQAQADVRRIAADTRSGLQETADLYGNFSRSAKELGANQDQAARATETFSKTLRISGADANNSAAATLQFGQALASGALRGDELNSILEAAPRLSRLLAESLGKPIGQIKAMGEAGELTSDKLLNALTNTKYTRGIDEEFSQLPVTFDQAMTSIENAAIITFGAFDRGGQFSTALANFITDGTAGFADLEKSAEDFGVSARANIEGLASAFAPVFAEGKRLFEFLGSGFQGVDIGRDIQKSLDQIDMITSKVGGTNFGGRFRAGQKAAQDRLRGEAGERAANALISPYLDRFGNPIQRASAPRPAAPARSVGPRSAGGRSARSSAASAEREREKAIRDEASKARESAQLQDDINAAKASIATATSDVLAFNLAQIESERGQRIAQYEAERKLGKLTDRELADRTASVNEIAGLQRQRVQQIADENDRRDALDVLQATSQNEQDLLRAQGALTDIRKERRAIELRLLDLAYDQEKAELESTLASKTASDAQKEIARARLGILDELRGYAKAASAQSNESPLQGYARKLGETDIGDQIESYVVDELNAVQDGIASALGKAIGTKDPLITGLLNLFIQQVIMKPLAEALQSASGGGGGGILGGLINAGRSIFGGGRDIGGAVHAGRSYDVGERGRERFIPQTNGVIVPNHALKSSASPTIVNQTFTLDARGGITTPELLQYVNSTASRAATQMGQVVSKGVLKAMPSRLSGFQRDGT